MCYVCYMRRQTWSDVDLKSAVSQCDNMSQVLRFLGLAISGGSYVNISNHIDRLGFKFAKTSRERQLSGDGFGGQKYSESKVFAKDSSVAKTTVSNRFREKAVESSEYFCVICKIGAWMDESITLHVDHINGDRYDHRLENLRLLCPNCHSQQPTTGKRNKVYQCVETGKPA